jgi:hypothetical protein
LVSFWAVLSQATLVLVVLFVLPSKGDGELACIENMSSSNGYPYIASNESNNTATNMTAVKKEKVDVANLPSPNSTSFEQFNNTDNNSSKFVVNDNITKIMQGTRRGFNGSTDTVNASKCSS